MSINWECNIIVNITYFIFSINKYQMKHEYQNNGQHRLNSKNNKTII